MLTALAGLHRRRGDTVRAREYLELFRRSCLRLRQREHVQRLDVALSVRRGYDGGTGWAGRRSVT